jgi:carboxyl-terminal processing protease
VAACLQDHHRAAIVGERTNGDCGIQNMIALKKEPCYLKITRGTLYRPSSKNLYKFHAPDGDDDEWGVSPDAKYVLHLSSKEQRELVDFLDRQAWILPPGQDGKEKAPEFKDRQLEMALAVLRSQCEKP